MTNKIMLIACGSFNPPTPMHLRMFEIAKDHFAQMGTHQVVGGIVSPVHDAYGKRGLVAQTHRLAMVKIALQTSSWIRLSDWECQQEEWTRTKNTLQYHQNYLNSFIKNLNGMATGNLPGWLPENAKKIKDPVQIKLLCGADLLESFATPGLWEPEDLEAILGQHGIVVISRNGSNPEQFIFDSDLLSKYRQNITIVTNWVANDVSSTLARRFISRGLSVKYLLDDFVIEYVSKNELYGASNEDVGSKYIVPTGNTTELLLTPISPESESSTFNESYIKSQNDRNEEEDYESMDETDLPPPPPPLKSTNLTIDYISSSSNSSLQKVFCCTSSDGQGIRLMRPGGAVQIISESITHANVNNDKNEKVGGEISTHIDTTCTANNVNGESTNDVPQLPLPTVPQLFKLAVTADDDDTTDSDSMTTSGTGGQRFSPSSYNDMIKFVFTQHGIKVISDKEYVV